MPELSNLRVAVIATHGFEESELTEPVKALKAAGARVDVISLKPGTIQGFQHHDKSIQVNVDRTLDDARSQEYDALMLPGGALNADALRMESKVRLFIREIVEANKPLAAICHAPWELISAEVVRGRTLTSYYTIEDDLRNAGAHWVDREVQLDRNWVTSRKPDDLPAFNRAMIKTFACMAEPVANSL